jgi:hypothetical protein
MTQLQAEIKYLYFMQQDITAHVTDLLAHFQYCGNMRSTRTWLRSLSDGYQ